MNVEQRKEKALELRSKGCNCCQSVVLACQDLVDVDSEVLRQIAAGFGGGMGCMEATCGALNGAVMIAGLISEGNRTTLLSRKILKDFEGMCKATRCKDLKGIGTGVVLCECPDCIRNAIVALTNNVEISQ